MHSIPSTCLIGVGKAHWKQNDSIWKLNKLVVDSGDKSLHGAVAHKVTDQRILTCHVPHIFYGVRLWISKAFFFRKGLQFDIWGPKAIFVTWHDHNGILDMNFVLLSLWLFYHLISFLQTLSNLWLCYSFQIHTGTCYWYATFLCWALEKML